MSTSPPSGPPAGPPRGPLGPGSGGGSVPPVPPGPSSGSTDQPEPPAQDGRRRRTLVMVGAGVVVALGLAVALVAMLRGGGDDGGGGPDQSSPPAASVLADTPADREKAHALAARVAMAPADWGPEYTKSDPYETDPTDESEVTKDCEWVTRASRAGTLASINRSVYHTKTLNGGSTEVRVFTDTATAESYMRDVQDATHRCPAQHSGKSRWTGIREATAPEVSGFDEVLAEEGTQVADSDGQKTNSRYVYYTGRVDNTVLITIAHDKPANAATLNKHATDVLQKLQQRLVSASQQ